jgi:hypothetical protein
MNKNEIKKELEEIKENLKLQGKLIYSLADFAKTSNIIIIILLIALFIVELIL